MDSEILALVSDMSVADLVIEAATAAGYRQCEVCEESYPVLVADGSAKCDGLLIGGLSSLAVERILFFEGEEYALKPVTVVREREVREREVRERPVRENAAREGKASYDYDTSCSAYYFSDTGAYTVKTESWDYANWQHHHKSSFIDASAAYMNLFGKMTAFEADVHWLEINNRENAASAGLNKLPVKLVS